MKKQCKQKYGAGKVMMTAIVFFGLGVGLVQAAVPVLKINTRPLTPQEIKDYGLATDTQTAGGTQVVGLGQPVYLELLVDAGTVVTQAVWSLDSVVNADGPIASLASITNSPLGLEIPTYNSVDRVHYDVVDRAVIVPDVKGTYTISVQALTSNDTLNASLDVVGSVFLVKDYVACTLCHASKQAGFNQTGHTTALTRKINDPAGHFNANCIKCHALGYDVTQGAVNSGFDDVASDLGWTFPSALATNNWDDMPLALQQKSNVQCENCHGPAQEHMRAGGDTSKIGVSLSAGNCGQCHDAQSHHVKNFQWGQSLHGNTEVDRGDSSCARCHTAAGFINFNDPGINEYGVEVPTTATFTEGITCAACHDPHGPASGAHQIREIGDITLFSGDVITAGGKGKICMGCHISRRDAETYVYGKASTHFGPHHGPQTDMLAGVNAIEYGQDLPTSKHLTQVADSCAQCHMQETPVDVPAYAKNHVGGHTFTLAYDDGTNAVVHLTETCASCHGDIEDFDFGGEDYNSDGLVEGVQTEIHHLMDELAMLLPPVGSTEIGLHTSTAGYDTLPIKRAVYNFLFVEEDGSHGVHNPKYAAALLRSSIADLQGGIDIDCDGLVDAWEIENFGNLTSQSGMDDWDSDGLNNIEEYRLGTDPQLADTDADGYSDLVELQGGSNPLEITSVPEGDLVLLPAVELAYLPKGTNTVVQFQAIESLKDGSWTSVGPAQTNDGNWVYQLENVRTNGNARFYRATED